MIKDRVFGEWRAETRNTDRWGKGGVKEGSPDATTLKLFKRRI